MGLVVGDLVAVTYKSTYAAQQIRYNLHYRVTTAGSSSSAEADLVAIATYFGSTLTNPVTMALAALHVPDFNFDSVTAQRVYPSRTISMETFSSHPGTLAGIPAPPNVAIVLTKRTLTAGRQGIGSLHLSGVNMNSIIDGEINPAIVADYNPLKSALLDALTVTSIGCVIEPVLWNPGNPPTFFSRLFDILVQSTTRVMRRRTVRVGI